MRVIWLVLTFALGSLVVTGCSETSGSHAFSARRDASNNICVNAVAKRTGSSNVSIYRTLSYENFRSVWLSVDGGREQFNCVVEKNGPDSFFINTVRRL